MHWFWRGAIAVGAGLLCYGLWYLMWLWGGKHLQMIPWPPLLIVVQLTSPIIIPVVVYGLLTYRYGPQAVLERETRCRKCQYILKGITEPRCPECGERI